MKDHTPQLEDGFVRFATEWLEEFIKADYPGAVKEFVLVIARETWGWNETWREIPMPRIAELLGVTISWAKQMRDAAVGRNLVEWQPGTGPKASGSYRVQKNYRDWIPQRVSGEWARKHKQDTGEGVLTGEDALTGKDALPATGEDVLSTNRLGRTNHLIDKDRHSKDSTPNNLLPEPAVPALPEPDDAEQECYGSATVALPEPEPPKKKAKPRAALTEDEYQQRHAELLARIPADCHALCDAYLDAKAAENKSGKMRASKVITLLSELVAVAEEFSGSNGAFQYGLQAAVRNSAPNANYVRIVAGKHGEKPSLFPGEARMAGQPAPQRQLTEAERQIAAVRAAQQQQKG